MIESNSLEAQSCATSISQGAVQLSGQVASSKDTSSDYLGNQEASSAIDLEQVSVEQLSSQLLEFVNLLHQTAQEFQAMDAQLSHQILDQLAVPSSPYSSNFSPRPGLF